MLAAISGITSMSLVIFVGWILAHAGLVTREGRKLMAGLAFTVGLPALLFSLMAKASLTHLFSQTLLASVLAVAAAGGVYLLVARWLPGPRGVGPAVIGFMASCYTNAAHFGLPIAIAMLGDATWTAPILLLQVALIQPTCLALLDVARARDSGERLRITRYLSLPFRNTITVAILLGLAVNISGLHIPDVLMTPITQLGGLAMPLMLMAFGVSLRQDPLPGRGPHLARTVLAVGLKVVGHPLAAWAIGRFVFGLSGEGLYAVVVLGALPTAQNVFIIAARYGRAELLARDSVFWSTLLSAVSLVVIAALLAG